ncbi:MAG: DNA repair protein RecN [Clostridia bacterium]|nr:DNA repair protein RecN [Clostridia bacterium]
MLSSLHIENVAVIRRLDIDFKDGFTVLSGQTGAGKSVILDCIELLLGAKADKELIRHGESQAVIEGVFDNITDTTAKALGEAGIPTDEDGALMIRRVLSTDGRSQLKLNGRSVTLAVLRNITYTLVNIHGQSDTSALEDPESHIGIVDTYAMNTGLLSEYSHAFSQLEEIRHRIREIKERSAESERLKEILEYQIRDIDSAGLHDGEEEELVEKKVKLRNSEKLTKNAEFIYKALRGSEKGSVAYLLDRSITATQSIAGFLPEFSEYAERLRDMLYQVEDISEEVYSVLDGLDSDPTEALNLIESRLDKINKLKRKYGLTVKDILEFRGKCAEELDTLENCEDLLKKLGKGEREAYKSALMVADKLHERRVSSAKELEARVRETLEFLDMPKVVFFANITETYDGEDKVLNKNGSDTLEFYISANLGADPQPISKIASGGELARVMLALKGVITDKDGVSTVIFDEIDAGVSGKTARKIGIKMLELARNTQLFCVTHSAQIASLADTHYLISKSEVDGATETHVEKLDFDGRVAELSRILGGINITDSQRRAALDMLNERSGYIG